MGEVIGIYYVTSKRRNFSNNFTIFITIMFFLIKKVMIIISRKLLINIYSLSHQGLGNYLFIITISLQKNPI